MLFYPRVDGSGSQQLRDLLASRPSPIEIDRAALKVARLEYPDLDARHAISELDRYACMIADRAHDLTDVPGFVEAANDVLFDQLGLQGNDEDYYNPDNNYLNRVLESKLGIPISLSVIYIEVARHLAKPVSGIGLPMHFLVRHDDGQYATFIDPYRRGALLDAEGWCRVSQTETLDPEPLEPVDRRSIAMRINQQSSPDLFFSARAGEL
jgi:regulator of sirC expression with transglutaminase-like and TPR domain